MKIPGNQPIFYLWPISRGVRASFGLWILKVMSNSMSWEMKLSICRTSCMSMGNKSEKMQRVGWFPRKSIIGLLALLCLSIEGWGLKSRNGAPMYKNQGSDLSSVLPRGCQKNFFQEFSSDQPDYHSIWGCYDLKKFWLLKNDILKAIP